jgi:uncharacterized protein YndB with AHSA1/START domain
MIIFYWVIGIGACVGGLVLLATLLGCFLPRTRVGTGTRAFQQSPEVVWMAITDGERIPSWWSALEVVERLPDRNGHTVWRQTFKGRHVVLEFESMEVTPPFRLVHKIIDVNRFFDGQWEYDLKATSTEAS